MLDRISSSYWTITTGSSLTLSCTSRGSPPDIFTWSKDGSALEHNISTLTHDDNDAVFQIVYYLHNATSSDSGAYTCNVTNLIGSDSETFTVIVVGTYKWVLNYTLNS